MPEKPVQLSTTVSDIRQLASNVKQFRLAHGQPLRFAAGQFVIAHVPHQGTIAKRAYSIASPPYETGYVELCIQMQEGGIASTYFNQLTLGDRVTLTGPHGTFVLPQPVTYDPVFLAVGTGIAPLRSMYRQLLHDGCERQIWSFLGVRYETDVLYDEESRALKAAHDNFWYIPTVSRPKAWPGETGYVQEKFKKFIPVWDHKEIFICGWTERVKHIAADLTAYGVPTQQIHYEEWG